MLVRMLPLTRFFLLLTQISPEGEEVIVLRRLGPPLTWQASDAFAIRSVF